MVFSLHIIYIVIFKSSIFIFKEVYASRNRSVIYWTTDILEMFYKQGTFSGNLYGTLNIYRYIHTYVAIQHIKGILSWKVIKMLARGHVLMRQSWLGLGHDKKWTRLNSGSVRHQYCCYSSKSNGTSSRNYYKSNVEKLS